MNAIADVSATPWTLERAQAIYNQPFADLLYTAQTVHRRHFDANAVQKSRLVNIKTGGCPEDCGYCSQSAKHDSGLKASKRMAVDDVLAEARAARAEGATRYCMGAAWRSPKPRDMPALVEMIREVKALGLETCLTAGMLDGEQAQVLKAAGLDYYNHNVDTSERFYPEVITTRTFQDRLDTLAEVRAAGLKQCCGGILGLGETVDDRLDMLVTLANLPTPPESVPLNQLVPIPGTPMAGVDPVDAIDFVRTVATARILMPTSVLRLAAGRNALSDAEQALCFLAGANSIFIGDRLLTTDNNGEDRDSQLFARLGLTPAAADA